MLQRARCKAENTRKACELGAEDGVEVGVVDSLG